MSEKVRVMHIIDSLGYGGTEIILHELLSRLISFGFDMSVCYLESGPLLEKYSGLGIPLIRIPWLARVDPLLMFKICGAIRQKNPRIVHTHLFKSDFHGVQAAKICKTPVVLSTLHSTNEWARKPLFGLIYGLVMRRADKVIAMSEKMRDYFIENSHIPCSKFQVIDNAISVEKYENKSDDGRAVRAELGIPPEVPLFGFVARLDPPKDHATFLRSAVQILRVDANARFLIVGDGVLRQSLQELATKLGIERSVIFCGFRKDVPAILSAIDVLVLCSFYEGQPVSVMEAMAASRPVVATNVLGTSSIVVDGKTGFLVAGENPAAVADACIRLMNDSSLRQRMGQAGNIHIKARHSIDVMAQKTANLYTSLLKDRGITL